MKSATFKAVVFGMAACLAAGTPAYAYIYLNWESGPMPLLEFGNDGTTWGQYDANTTLGVDAGSHVQLIWDLGTTDGGLVGPDPIGLDGSPTGNDVLLDGSFTVSAPSGYEGYVVGPNKEQYDYTDVGLGADDGTFEAGNVYVRVFQDPSGSIGPGSHYYQGPLFTGLTTDPDTGFPPPDTLRYPTDQANPTALDMTIVPEPGTLALFGLGLATVAMRRRLRK